MKSLLSILSHKKYFAPAFVFATLNIVYGTWAIYIPTIKEQLGLNKSQLGIAIFFLALGNLGILSVAPKIIRKYGSGKATKLSVVILLLGSVLPFVSFSYTSLMAALCLQGAAQGLLDISMNNLVTVIEKRDRINLMSAMHGFFSLGGAVAGLGTFIIVWLDNPLLHISVLAILVLIINLALAPQYTEISETQNESTSIDWNYLKTLFLLGVISFVSMGSEGAIVDWSGLYLKEINLAPSKMIGAGFLGFSIAMTTGRFLGDSISEKFGSHQVIILGATIASVGYLFVLSNTLLFTIMGFVLIGLGFSVMVPELFRLTGKISNIDSAKALALIAGCGYSGFLIGPVILGFTAEKFGLETSFMGLLSASLLVLCLSIYQLFKLKKKA